MRPSKKLLLLSLLPFLSCQNEELANGLDQNASSQERLITITFDDMVAGHTLSSIRTDGIGGSIGVLGAFENNQNKNKATITETSIFVQSALKLSTFSSTNNNFNNTGNILTVANNIDQTSDQSIVKDQKTTLSFDFSKYSSGSVTLHSFEIINLGSSKSSTIRLYDINNKLVKSIEIKSEARLSKNIVDLSKTQNIAKMEILLGDLIGIDNMVLSCEPVDPPCAECVNGLRNMTLQYNGETEDLDVRVLQQLENRYEQLFRGFLNPGEELILESTDGVSPLGKELRIYVEDQFFRSITADCSEPIGNGFQFGEFEIVDATLLNGRTLCDGTNNEEEVEPEKCCENSVSNLKLEYLGTNGLAQVSVLQEGEDGPEASIEIFRDNLFPGQRFDIEGIGENGSLREAISLRVNGEESAFVATTCEQEIGPGRVEGDFKVISGSDVNGNILCPIRDCCNTFISSLTLFYQETFMPAEVVVLQFDPSGNARYLEVFRGQVEPFGFFTITGKDKQGGFGKEILVYVNGILNTVISTTCLTPINEGMVTGSFEIVDKLEVFGEVICRSR